MFEPGFTNDQNVDISLTLTQNSLNFIKRTEPGTGLCIYAHYNYIIIVIFVQISIEFTHIFAYNV